MPTMVGVGIGTGPESWGSGSRTSLHSFTLKPAHPTPPYLQS